MAENPWEGLTKEEALQKIRTLIRIYTVFLHSGKADIEYCSAKLADLRDLRQEILEGKRETQFPSR